jgi:predicted acyltransferase
MFFSPLLHATWHGLTPTDLVFPFFIFVVGGAMSFSFKKAIESRCFNWLNIIRRTFLLIGIGVLLNAFPFQISFNDLRFPGVLQRIGICFILTAVLIRFIPTKHLWKTVFVMLACYFFLLNSVASTPYSPENNLVKIVDELVLGQNHMYSGLGFAFDPEGIVSTISATITCLLGFILVQRVQVSQSSENRFESKTSMFIIGLGLGRVDLSHR